MEHTRKQDGQAVPYTKQHQSARNSQRIQKDDILPTSSVCFPSMSGSNRQESSGVHRESRTGRCGGNEGTGARTEKTSVPQKPGCHGPTDHSGELGSQASQAKNSQEAPAATSSCRSRDRGMPFCGERPHGPVVLGTKPSLSQRLGHTCFCPETLRRPCHGKSGEDRDLSLHQGLENLNPAFHIDLLSKHKARKEWVPWLTPSSTCKEPGVCPHQSWFPHGQPQVQHGWLFVAGKKIYRVCLVF